MDLSVFFGIVINVILDSKMIDWMRSFHDTTNCANHWKQLRIPVVVTNIPGVSMRFCRYSTSSTTEEHPLLKSKKNIHTHTITYTCHYDPVFLCSPENELTYHSLHLWCFLLPHPKSSIKNNPPHGQLWLRTEPGWIQDVFPDEHWEKNHRCQGSKRSKSKISL